MNISSSNLLHSENENNNNNNSKSEKDENVICDTDINEQNMNSNELFEIDSSDLDEGGSDQEQNKNDLEQESHCHEKLNKCTKTDNTNPTVQIICHSNKTNNDNNTKINESDSSTLTSNCSNDNETLTTNDDNAEEDEPIFDFLGKANEIVCYFIFYKYVASAGFLTQTNLHSLLILVSSGRKTFQIDCYEYQINV